MDTLDQLLRRPIVTEKASLLKEKNKFVIEVVAHATKPQIRQALESRFKVNVLGIKTIRLPGKYRRRMGPIGGYRPDRKKAIVELKPGQQITWEEVA